MGDRTSFQVVIYDCPPEQASAVLDIINNYGLGVDWGNGETQTDVLFLGQLYTEHEMSCGTSDEMANLLQDEAPGASWELWEDPKYEWLGGLYRYTPSLGKFFADCDAAGSPQFTEEQVWRWRAADEDELAIHIGRPWADALAAFEPSRFLGFTGSDGLRHSYQIYTAIPRQEEA